MSKNIKSKELIMRYFQKVRLNVVSSFNKNKYNLNNYNSNFNNNFKLMLLIIIVVI
jgi:hypothetical protein